MASFLGSPLITPFFAIVNVFVGYFILMFIIMPISHWKYNLYDAYKFPIFSSHLFNAQGQTYNVSAIVNDKFELDIHAYEKQGRIHLSTFFALNYGIGFAAIISTLTHVALFNGREIYICIFKKDQIQMPWWALLFEAALALIFTLPISIISATTNMTPGLNIIREYIMGIIYPGRPIANVWSLLKEERILERVYVYFAHFEY